MVTRTVKNLPLMQESRVQSLGGEDLLEKGMATHSNILAGKISWTEEPGRFHGSSAWDHKEVEMTECLTQMWKILSCVMKN